MQDLRDLFTLRSHTQSDTYDCMCTSHLTDTDSERLLAAPGRWRNQASPCDPDISSLGMPVGVMSMPSVCHTAAQAC